MLKQVKSFLESNGFSCPSDQPQHLMGLDGNGQDEFSRILYGARVSLVAGVAAVSFAVLIGVRRPGRASSGAFDNGVMRVMDVMLAFPALLLAIAIVTARGRGCSTRVIAVSIVTIPVYARVVARVISVPSRTS